MAKPCTQQRTDISLGSTLGAYDFMLKLKLPADEKKKKKKKLLLWVHGQDRVH